MLARLAAFLMTGLLFFPSGPLADSRVTVTVFAAASTKPALDALAPTLEAEGIDLRLVYAGSSTLARQIIAGAPADIYISANAAWMDDLDDKELLVAGTRVTVATNRLVLIAHAPQTAPTIKLGADFSLADTLNEGRLAMADPDNVPVGIYGRQALAALGLWTSAQDHLAVTSDVNGALLLVARGEAPLGIVYASDVARSADVWIFATFPAESHDPIVYPAAIIQGHDSTAARTVLQALTGPKGRAAFKFAGFLP